MKDIQTHRRFIQGGRGKGGVWGGDRAETTLVKETPKKTWEAFSQHKSRREQGFGDGTTLQHRPSEVTGVAEKPLSEGHLQE